ncbi:MAG TPA: sugar transferase [Gemmatimonadales bacterium]|nr:sugar transferase [Gemmatimonadales bacterium]
MAEPHSLVRLDAYRSAAVSDVDLGPTWWDRHGLSPKPEGAENLGNSHDEGPDTARLRSVKADPTPNATQDLGLEAAVQGDESASVTAGFKAWSTAYVLRLALFDMLVGSMAVAIPSLNSNNLGTQESLIVTLSLLGAIVWPATVAGARGYDRRRIGFGNDEIRSIMRAAMGLVLVGAFWAGLFGAETFLKLAVVATPFAALMSLGVRFLAHQQLHRRQRSGVNVRRVVVVGGWAAAKHLRERLDAEPAGGMKIVGACIPTRDIVYASELGMPVLGSLDDASHVVKKFNCDAVAVTSDDTTRQGYLRRLSWSLEGAGVEMFVDPGLVEVAGPRMHIRPHVGLPLLHIEEPHFTGWRRICKRGTDIVLTIVGLIVISPLLALIAAAIKLQDGGPVIFRQTRIGRNGEPFTMFKFRSMVVDAEARWTGLIDFNEGHGALFKLSNDPRVTRLGNLLREFSLDELPQLFNVLLGNMSLVGPRPHLEHEIAAMHTDAVRRSLVTPGMTGLWQISGRSDLSGEDSLRLDLRYVENWSFTLDLLILWKTLFAVLAKQGAK